MEGKFCFYRKLTAGGISNHEARFRQMPRRFENGKTRDPMGSPRLSVSIGSPHQPNRETARQRDEFDAGSSPFNDSYKVVSGNLDRLSFHVKRAPNPARRHVVLWSRLPFDCSQVSNLCLPTYIPSCWPPCNLHATHCVPRRAFALRSVASFPARGCPRRTGVCCMGEFCVTRDCTHCVLFCC